MLSIQHVSLGSWTTPDAGPTTPSDLGVTGIDAEHPARISKVGNLSSSLPFLACRASRGPGVRTRRGGRARNRHGSRSATVAASWCEVAGGPLSLSGWPPFFSGRFGRGCVPAESVASAPSQGPLRCYVLPQARPLLLVPARREPQVPPQGSLVWPRGCGMCRRSDGSAQGSGHGHSPPFRRLGTMVCFGVLLSKGAGPVAPPP